MKRTREACTILHTITPKAPPHLFRLRLEALVDATGMLLQLGCCYRWWAVWRQEHTKKSGGGHEDTARTRRLFRTETPVHRLPPLLLLLLLRCCCCSCFEIWWSLVAVNAIQLDIAVVSGTPEPGAHYWLRHVALCWPHPALQQ